MIVELIAWTHVHTPALKTAGWQPERPNHISDESLMADRLAEFAGRLCYQSWDRPNPATATSAGYLANILGQQHYSVLEHASATFYVAEVSRSLSHELVRHRHLSFSQVSQRYVDESQAMFVTPPAIFNQQSVVPLAMDEFVDANLTALRAYDQIVKALLSQGMSRKEARQAARSVLPNATETKFVVTGNMRAWRDVIAKRISPAADAEIRQLASRLLEELKKIAPNTFQDM